MAHPLTPVMNRLVETVASALPADDVRRVRELIDANQVELALEWLTDAVTASGMRVAPDLRQLLVQLGQQLRIAESIRGRLPA